MKKKDVAVGGRYAAKVSGKVVYVKITGVNVHGGWDAVNETTKKAVRIKGAGRLRYEAERREAIKAAVEKAYPDSTILPDGHPKTYRNATVADFGDPKDSRVLCKNCGEPLRMPAGLSTLSCPVCDAAKRGEPTGDAYLDSLPPERRAMALEARAKKAAAGPDVAGTAKTLGAIINTVDQEMRAKAACPKCGKPTAGIVMAGDTKQSAGLCVCGSASISPAAAPVPAAQPKQEDEVMAKSKKADVKATETETETKKAAPCGKCINCRKGARQMCLGAPKAHDAKASSKGAKPPAKRNVAHTAAPGEKRERKPSALNLAADVLKKAGKAMHQKELAAAVITAGWKTEGKTPASTLYAAIIREIAAKGKESRFARGDEKGTFKFAG